MYYPVGLPRRLWIPGRHHGRVKAIVCNRDRILFAVLTENSIWIWFSRVCGLFCVYHSGVGVEGCAVSVRGVGGTMVVLLLLFLLLCANVGKIYVY